ncbi:MAG TPA: serine hydrolase domain-containing protein [Thermoanaerobaculia bacterium]|nr:serine hydrolase domain-containing protein [Thermoanaerobaculia bacterium]
MKVRILTILVVLAIALGAAAQPRKRVMIGGPDGDEAKDWPKAKAAAGVDGIAPYLDALVQRDLFSGVVLVIRNGQPVFQKAYGFANKDFEVPNTMQTRFNIGSINKIFTMTALKQLRDAGKLSFDDKLSRFLPQYAFADKITIAQMLEHSSGLGDFFGDEYDALPKDRIRTLSDYVPLFADKPLEFEPGAQRRYSNAAYILLGIVIEKISGMPYDEYLRTKIFTPAGMADTGAFDADAVVARRAVGYTRDGRSNLYSLPGHGSSAGGGYSTAADLVAFAKWAHIGDGSGFAGGAPGLNAAIEVEGGATIVVLSNYSPPAATEVAMNLRKLLGIGTDD